ncbi:MAG: ABC transporter ATP-binding protein, partial [bacterium]|nr:ABC transporter ATP-binding protein [bacterium]
MYFLRKIIPYIKPYKKYFFIAVLCMIFYSIFNASVSFILRDVIDDIFIKAESFGKDIQIEKKDYDLKSYFKNMFRKNDETIKQEDEKKLDSKDNYISTKEEGIRYARKALIFLSSVLVFIFLLKGVLFYIRKYLNFFIGERVILDLRNQLYEHLQSLSLQFFSEFQTGTLMSRITNDIAIIQNSVPIIGNKLIQEPINVVALIFVMFYLDWKLAAISLIVFPLVIYPIAKLGRKMNKATYKAQVKMGDLNAVIQEIISGIRIVKAFGMEKYEVEKFKDINQEFFNQVMKGHRAASLQIPLNEFIGSIAIALTIWYGGWNVVNGELTTGTFFSFLLVVFQLYNPVRSLGEANLKFQQASAALERIYEIFDRAPTIIDSDNSVLVSDFGNELSFKNVNFKYQNRDDLVLRNINLTVKKGSIIAIVGKSGAGKSTLVDLIPRFFDVSEGGIFLDGYNLKEIKTKSLRRLIGIVSQSTILFNDTVFNNIAYGTLDQVGSPSKEDKNRVIEAARIANAHDFIMKIPGEYNAMIGERGTFLSGGEAQRIAIARAVLKNPPILILDEATSSLDTESERMVQDALNKLIRNRTVFAIAHRLSTIVGSDCILVLKDGEIIEKGSHN